MIRGLPFRLSAGMLTFLIGVTLASAWFFSRHNSIITARVYAPAALSPAKAKRTYRDVDHASVQLRDGGYDASISTVESSDGMIFTSTVVVLPSADKAQEEMDKILQRASGIIKREPLFDSKAEMIGEKAVVTFTHTTGGIEGDAELLWRRGDELRRISGSSLENVLEYEKDYEW
ncbi:MAG TPA: hypothetical protein VF588_04860 [Pyrinomonadaceae bacterium]|jgi:hypothetical protein